MLSIFGVLLTKLGAVMSLALLPFVTTLLSLIPLDLIGSTFTDATQTLFICGLMDVTKLLHLSDLGTLIYTAGGAVDVLQESVESATLVVSEAAQVTATGAAQVVSEVMTHIMAETPEQAGTISLPLAIEYIAVIVGAIAGSATAWDKGLDIVGAVVLGLLTGFGGGLIRDVLINGANVYFIDTPGAVVLCTLASIIVYYFRNLFNHLNAPLFLLDTLALALFAFVGAEKGLSYGVNAISCMMLGAITGFGGGLMRDVCMGEMPQLFKQSNFYGICGIAGAAIYVLGVEAHLMKPVAALISSLCTVGLRLGSIKYNWRTQAPVDYSQHLLKPIKRIMRYNDGVQEVHTDTSLGIMETPEEAAPSQLIVIDKNEVLVVHEVDTNSPENQDPKL